MYLKFENSRTQYNRLFYKRPNFRQLLLFLILDLDRCQKYFLIIIITRSEIELRALRSIIIPSSQIMILIIIIIQNLRALQCARIVECPLIGCRRPKTVWSKTEQKFNSWKESHAATTPNRLLFNVLLESDRLWKLAPMLKLFGTCSAFVHTPFDYDNP